MSERDTAQGFIVVQNYGLLHPLVPRRELISPLKISLFYTPREVNRAQ